MVSQESASLPDYTNQCMDVNHFQLNKFTGPDDGYYKSVIDALRPMVKNAMLLMAEGTYESIICSLRKDYRELTSFSGPYSRNNTNRADTHTTQGFHNSTAAVSSR